MLKGRSDPNVYEIQIRNSFYRANYCDNDLLYQKVLDTLFGRSRAEIFFKKGKEYIYVGFLVFSSEIYFDEQVAIKALYYWLESKSFLKYKDDLEPGALQAFLLIAEERHKKVPWHQLSWFFSRKISNSFYGINVDVSGGCYTFYFSSDKNYHFNEERKIIKEIGESVYKIEYAASIEREKLRIRRFLQTRQEEYKNKITEFFSKDLETSGLAIPIIYKNAKKEFNELEKEVVKKNKEYQKLKKRMLERGLSKEINLTILWQWLKEQGSIVPQMGFYNTPPVFESKRSNSILCVGCALDLKIKEIGTVFRGYNFKHCSDTRYFWEKFFGIHDFLDNKYDISIPCAIISSGYIKNYSYLGSETLYIEERLLEICKIWSIPFQKI